MGDATDLVLSGDICQGCGEWMEDIINGASSPGHPRWCPSCTPARSWPQNVPFIASAESIKKALPGIPVKEYDNQGTLHLKFRDRFNIWPHPRRVPKWWDAATNTTGKGADEFVAYVRKKVEGLEAHGL